MKAKTLASLVSLLAAAVLIGGILLLMAYREDRPIEDTANYTIHIHTDGTATISVNDIGYIQQLDKDTPYGAGYYLRPGTLIIPGDGSQIEYEYPRRDRIKN